MVTLATYIKKFADNLLSLFTTIKGFVFLIVSQFIALQGVRLGIAFLSAVFIIDLITGLSAAYKESKKSITQNTAPYFIQSKKLRMSLLKGITYMLAVILSYILYSYIFDAQHSIPGSTKTFTIIELTFGVCIAIESWSIIENLKRMGFDIIGKIVSLVKNIRKTVKSVKDEE